jgi:TolB protein
MAKRHIVRPLIVIALLVASASLVTYSQAPSARKTNSTAPAASLTVPGEKHLANVRQLTFGGTNAEAYFSADDKNLIFMHQGEGVPCDQMFTMPVDTPDGKPAVPKMVSTGKGRTTCGYYFPGDKRILFSSTHATSAACPPVPDYSHGYVWPIYNSYEIYTANPDGSDLRALSHSPGSYNAESTISRDGKKLCSLRPATATSMSIP